MKLFSAAMLVCFSLLCSNAVASESLEYSIKIAGINFGTATLFKSKDKFYGELKTNERWGTMYSVDNKMASWVGPNKTPKRTEIDYNVRNRKSKYNFLYNTSGKVSVTRWRPHKKPVTYVTKTRAGVHDFLSMMNVMRAKAGNDVCSFSIITGKKVYDVNFTKRGEEETVTGVGAKQSIVYDVSITRPGNFKQDMRVWFGKDNPSTPLKLAGTTKLGNFEVSLTKKMIGSEK